MLTVRLILEDPLILVLQTIDQGIEKEYEIRKGGTVWHCHKNPRATNIEFQLYIKLASSAVRNMTSGYLLQCSIIEYL